MSTPEDSIPQPESAAVSELVLGEPLPFILAVDAPPTSTPVVTITAEATTIITTEAVTIAPPAAALAVVEPPSVSPPAVSPVSPPNPLAPPADRLPSDPKKSVESSSDTSQPEPSVNLTIPKPSTSHRRSPLTSGKGEGKRKRAITPVTSTPEENAENNNGVEENKDVQMRLPTAEADAPPATEPEFTEDFSRPSQPTEAMLTSDELNFLVYRYLLESGFVHSAFVFGGESYVSKTNIEDTAQLVPGALISFVQKGLQYLEIESHINDDGTETVCDEAFSVMKPHVCSTNTTKKRIFEPYEPMSADYGFLELDDDEVLFLKAHEDLITTCVWSPNGNFLATGSADGSTRVWDIQHQAIPGKCSSPLALLKSGSKIEGEGSSGDKKTKSEEPTRKRPRARKSNVSTQSSVLAVAWKDDNVLATGSYDGTTQVWTATGQLLHSSVNHQGPICCVQWAKKGGTRLATGGMDNAVTILNEDGTVLTRYTHHAGPILDLDWKNDNIFATASTDHKVCVFELGKSEPLRELVSHRGDVNAVRWDADGHFLASCGADCAVKVWNVLTGACVHDFREHTREVVCIAWAPSSSSSLSSSLASPKASAIPSTPSTSFSTTSSSSSALSTSSSSPSLLASGSMDTTIKIWDLVHGKCCLTIAKHAHPVTSLAFSPQGDSLVSGAHERLCMWSVKNGDLLRTFKHEGGINHLCWNNDGKLAAGYSDNLVCVMDLRSVKAE